MSYCHGVFHRVHSPKCSIQDFIMRFNVLVTVLGVIAFGQEVTTKESLTN